jgi:glycosyltransferase involved in cell wall biosynthesis
VEPAQALAAELAFSAAEIAFTGYAEYGSVPDLYRRADVFVSPTYAEGFSNTILEALAAGLATVSCHAVGVSDCLRDGENGLLVDPGDVPAQAAALTRIITDEGLRRRIATAGLEECRRVYSWHAVGQQIMEIYGRVRHERPATDFTPDLPYDPSCRFRAEPHLL